MGHSHGSHSTLFTRPGVLSDDLSTRKPKCSPGTLVHYLSNPPPTSLHFDWSMETMRLLVFEKWSTRVTRERFGLRVDKSSLSTPGRVNNVLCEPWECPIHVVCLLTLALLIIQASLIYYTQNFRLLGAHLTSRKKGPFPAPTPSQGKGHEDEVEYSFCRSSDVVSTVIK